MTLPQSVVAWLTDPIHWSGPDGIPARVFEHLVISVPAVFAAIAIALPIGLAIGHSGRGSVVAINTGNIARAVPSYALMVAVLPLTLAIDPVLGLAVLPTFIAMVALAIPPILLGAYTGVREVDRDLVEAARGMGMRERQILGRVELPIALPVVVGGIRTASVQVVATATLGAILGYGGLGRYLIDGVARQEFDRLFAGVILVAGLALLTEAGFALAQRRLTSPGVRPEVPGATPGPVMDAPAPTRG